MNATKIRSEITKTDARLSQLAPWRQKLREIRARNLLQPEDDGRAQEVLAKIEHGWRHEDGVLSELAGGLNPPLPLPRTESEIARLEERRRLLVDKLPSPEEVAKAEQRAAKLVKRANAERAKFAKAWSAYMAAMTGGEVTARRVVVTRSDARATLNELAQLREEYALDVEVPREPTPNLAESKLAGITGVLLSDVGCSLDISPQLDAEVAGARRQVEREEAAA